jgi:UDP-glucuronate 4-epimerase
MRFLITGALGAIGVWTMRSLLERGHAVIALDLSGAGHRLPLALDERQAAAVTHVKADITDLTAVERVIDEHDVTNAIHLAALQVPFVRADPVLGARVNVLGTVHVLEAIRRRAERMGPLVYASSVAVYGAAGTLDADDHPGTLYGVYKRDNESSARRYLEDYGVSSVGLRPHTVYGPARDQGLTSAPTTAMVAAAAGRRYRIPFGGSAQLQYTPDVGEAFARTALLEYEGASVHNLDGAGVAMTDLAAMIGAASGNATITAAEAPLPFPSDLDGSSFVELLGGSVMRPLEDGVADAVRRFERLLAEGRVKPPEEAATSPA